MASRLVAGVDYPRNRHQLRDRFGTDEQCRDSLFRLRYPAGWWCPVCAADRFWWRSSFVVRCLDCRRQASVLAGTIFERTRTPMPVWFEVGWAVATAKNGLSAVELQSDYGLGSYETASTMLHRYRRAMVFAERSKLAGYVEADEAYYGGRRAGKKGRSPGKTIVAIACEVHSPRSSGRIRLQAVPDASAKSLHFFLHDTVERGATVITDHWSGYRGLPRFDQQPVSITHSPDPAHVVMPAVHQVASLLKRSLLGTHQGRVERRQLQAYLDAFAFRFNRRRATKPGMRFHRLIEGSVARDPVTYQTVAAGI